MATLLFENLVPNTGINNREKFIEKVKHYSNMLLINPNWLMAVMYIETGGKFTPDVKNPSSSATGLIQFMSNTAVNLGTTTQQLAQMSNYEQMYYVYKYLSAYRGKMLSYPDVYMAVFAPASLGRLDEYKVYGGSTVTPNKALDYDKDGYITAGEIKKWAWSRIPVQYHNELKKKV